MKNKEKSSCPIRVPQLISRFTVIPGNAHRVIEGLVSKRLHNKVKKPLLKQTEHWELNNFTNIVSKIDVDALKI